MTVFDPGPVVQALTGDIGLRAFNDTIRERRATRFEAAIGAETCARLFDLSTMESLFASGAIPLASVDLYEGGQLTRLADVQNKSGKTGLAIITERFRGGATIRLRDVDSCDLRLSQFAAAVRRRFAAQSQINVYLTPPRQGGFPPHFDITDVFILQCLGAKEWRLFERYTTQVDLPLPDTNWDPDRYRPLDTPGPTILSAGDVLYIPRGVMHQTSCAERASLHLTISLTPLTFVDLITRELQRVAATSLGYRQRVPWSVEGDDPAETTRIADTARSCLRELAAALDVSAMIDAERRLFQKSGAEAGSPSGVIDSLGHLFDSESEAPFPSSPAASGGERKTSR